MLNKLISSTLAGICIGIGGAAYLQNENIIGAILFAFGLLAVVQFKLLLYTGFVGFAKEKEWFDIPIILIGNVFGCILVAILTYPYLDGWKIIDSRIEFGYLSCFFRAILCGIIMTLAVASARKENWLLVLFGIPLFIRTGFCHSIADAYYMFAVRDDWRLVVEYLPYWGTIILGNGIGCNIPRYKVS